MRVLHVSPYFAPAFCYGGPPRSILGLCRALPSTVEVNVYTTTANGESELAASDADGSTVDGIPVWYFPRSFPVRFFRSAALGRALQTAEYDLIHVHGLWNFPSHAAVVTAIRSGTPFVVSPRGMLQEAAVASRSSRIKWLSFELAERRNLARAAFLHSTSDAETQRLRALFPKTRVVEIPNGVDFPASISRPELSTSSAEKTIVYLGRLHRLKRIDLLLSAFLSVAAHEPTARLVIAGADEDGTKQRVSSMARELGDRVQWVGALSYDAKFELLRSSDVLVQCSDSESFGVSIAEALAVGVPAVVTRTCPWPDLERVGAGFWVDQNSDAIADGILRALADPDRNREMGRRGAEWARSRFAWTAIGEEMTRHYNQAVPEAGRRSRNL